MITGRASGTLEGKDVTGEGFKACLKRTVGILDISEVGEEELEKLRVAVMTKEGLMISIFDILRKVPRRVLMILKLNDLTRQVLGRIVARMLTPIV